MRFGNGSKPRAAVFDTEERAVTEQELAPPYLFVDLYPLDVGPAPRWSVLAQTPHIAGAIIKATQGTTYPFTSWFTANWSRLRFFGGARYGEMWFRGAYHFLVFGRDGAAQADYYLHTIEKAGGWDSGDMIPIVDVELGGERNPNRNASSQQIIDCTSAWVERVKLNTGRRVMLYGRGAMRDLAISSKMGCDVVWNPSYTRRMATNGLVALNGAPGPWKLDDIALWQYGGDGVGDNALHGLPLEINGFGAVDVSVYIDGGRATTLDSLRARLL
jgi:GH25 family lysozyme M1 (1,4-beta-N-acetylmuramidase)